jgi:anti-anti-sigma factor
MTNNETYVLSLSQRKVGGVFVIDIDGRLTLHTVPLFEEMINQIIGPGQVGKSVNVLLNLKNTSYLDSSGLRELLTTHIKVLNSKGRLILCNLSPKIRDLLIIMKLYYKLEVCEDEDSALPAFQQPK